MGAAISTVANDGRDAMAYALRVSAMAAAIYPTDRQMFRIFGDALIPDLTNLALHGRRVMEAYGVVDTPLAKWGFWPNSSVENPVTANLHDAFGHILHATGIRLGWEKFSGDIDAYKGRECRFLGHVRVISSAKCETYVLGSIAASFLCGVTKSLAQLSTAQGGD
jgi:hypothetical protein